MRVLSLRTALVAAALSSPFAACSPYSPDLSAAPFLCGTSDPKCPDGYECKGAGTGSGSAAAGVCVKPNGTVPVDATGAGCNDDSTLEPNNTIQQAFQTPVDSNGTKKTFPLAGLAICPTGDKDFFSATLSKTENLELIVEFDTGGAMLQASILNAAGTPIANASQVVAGKVRAYTANLPAGTYYAEVSGPSSGSLTTNNYKLTLTVTP